LAIMSSANPSEWARIRNIRSADLDATLRATIHAHFPFADEVMPHGKLPGGPILRVLGVLSDLDQPNVAMMASALLEQAAQALGHRGGEYLTPRSVRNLVVAISEPAGTVYNPASGIGQLMIDAATNTEGTGELELVGQEVDTRVCAMARLNLAIHGVDAELSLGDVFEDDRYPQLRATRVISVPPWNMKIPIAENLAGDARWVWGEPGSNDGNAAWIQHCLYHLADGGRAVVVLANSALFEGGRAGRIRQRIVKAGLLDAVIALPPGLFAWTSMPCALLVFTKGRGGADGRPASTLMVDLSGATEGQGSRSASLPDEVVTHAAQLYRRWHSGEAPEADNAAVATFDDLAANDFVIDPGRYLSLTLRTPDLEHVSASRLALLDELERLTHASREADDQLKAILDGHQ
jgi:type I restriction enzyme M protein